MAATSIAGKTAWAVVAGVGPGTGASVARKFASSSYSVALLARSPSSFEPLVDEIKRSGGHAVGISTDCTDAGSLKDAFAQLRKEMATTTQESGSSSSSSGKLRAAIYNASGGFVRKPFLEVTEEQFTGSYDVGVRGAFLFAQQALPLLLEATADAEHPPTLIFTGATAAVKSSSMLSTFSHASYARRALSQSLAKEFGPRGVHVAHTIIDGLIDTPKTKNMSVSDQPDSKLDPAAIADAYWYLHTQPRVCWTQEIDVRPWVEKW